MKPRCASLDCKSAAECETYVFNIGEKGVRISLCATCAGRGGVGGLRADRNMGGGGFALALMSRPETIEELRRIGFEERTIWLKAISGKDHVDANRKGEAIFFGMRRAPMQFVGCTNSWWGEGDA